MDERNRENLWEAGDEMVNQAQDKHEQKTHDEACWLMSLALDDLLDEDEEQRLDALLHSEPELAREWSTWQWFDQELHAAPAIPAPDGFLERFELRLALQERQRRLRLGIFVALASLLMLGSVVAALAVLAAIFIASPTAWAGNLMDQGALMWAAFTAWVEVIWQSALVVFSTRQAQIGALCYVVASIAILAGWTQFLRHTTHASLKQESIQTASA